MIELKKTPTVQEMRRGMVEPHYDGGSPPERVWVDPAEIAAIDTISVPIAAGRGRVRDWLEDPQARVTRITLRAGRVFWVDDPADAVASACRPVRRANRALVEAAHHALALEDGE